MKVAFGVRAQYAAIALVATFMLTQVIGVVIFSGTAKAVGTVSYANSITSGFAGAFNDPAAVAVAPDGSYYIVSRTDAKIHRYDASGTAISTWGSAGAGNSEFNNPTAVAVSRAGEVYVLDAGNSRVQKFTAVGDYSAQWGSSGSGDSQFNTPAGIAVDPVGDVYVADTSNHRIQKFSSAGTFITEWGSVGNGDAQFAAPQGVAADNYGNIYVVQSGGFHHVKKFSNTGTFVSKFGANGTSDGQFGTAGAIAVDRAGRLYVGENLLSGSKRIQKLAADGTFITKWGSAGSGNGQFNFTDTDYGNSIGIASGPNGKVYVADVGNNRVQVFNDASFDLRLTTRAATAVTGAEATISANTTDTSNLVSGAYSFEYGTDTNYGSTISAGSNEITATGSFGSAGPDNTDGQINGAFDAAQDRNGNVYVIDMFNCQIQKFNSAGQFLLKWGSCSPGPGEYSFNQTWSLSVDPSGNVYVIQDSTYHGSNKIIKFDSAGEFISQVSFGAIGGTGITNYQIAVYNSDTIYISRGSSVDRLNAVGVVTDTAGPLGGVIENVSEMTLDAQGNVYVAANPASSNRSWVTNAYKLSANLDYVGAAAAGTTFSSIYDLATDADGNLYVRADKVYAYDSANTLQLEQTVGGGYNVIPLQAGGFIMVGGSGVEGVAPGTFYDRIVSADLSSLSCGTTYHYRAKAVANGDTVYGADQTFTTDACPEPFAITTVTLPNGLIGLAYDQDVETNYPNSFFYIISGDVPPGLSIGFDGNITGTPTTLGTYDFTVQALDNSGFSLGSDDQDLQIVVTAVPPDPFAITTTVLADGTVSDAYSEAIQTDSEVPVVFNIQLGSLPPGLSLSSNGVISGTPQQAGEYSFTVRGDDGYMTDDQALSISVASAAVVDPEPDPDPEAEVDPPVVDESQIAPDETVVDPEVDTGAEVTQGTPLAPSSRTTPLKNNKVTPIDQNGFFALARRIPEPFAIGFPWFLLFLALSLVAIQYYQVHSESQATKHLQTNLQRQERLVDEQNNFVALSTHYIHTPLTVMEGEITLMVKAGTLTQAEATKLQATLSGLSNEAEAVLAQEEQNGLNN